MASDDECGEGECHHGSALYWDEFQEWGDCATCYSGVARFRAWAGFFMWCMCEDASTVMLREHHAWSSAWAWQHFIDFLNGTPEQWQARAVKAYNRGLLAGTPIRFGDGR